MKTQQKAKVLTIKELAKASIAQKTFQFAKSDFNYNYAKLLTKGILAEQEEIISIVPIEEFTKIFFSSMSSELKFKLNQDFRATLDFTQRVENYYREDDRGVIGMSRQINSLLKYLLIVSRQKHGTDFQEIIPMFEAQEEMPLLRQFNTVFFENLLDLNLSVEQIIKITSFLISKLQTSLYHNDALIQIGNAISRHSSSREDIADEYLGYCMTEPNAPVMLFAPAIVGKYHSTGNKCDFLKAMIVEAKTHLPIITAVSAFGIRDEMEAHAVINVIESISPHKYELSIGLPRFYIKLLGNNNLIDTAVIDKCFSALQALLKGSDLRVKQQVLHNLRLVDGYDEKINELVLSIGEEINNGDLHDGISNALAGRSSPKYFFRFVEAYVAYGKKFPVSSFDYPIHHFLNEAPEEFSSELISLLIHDLGWVRLAAGKIMKSIYHPRRPFNFAIDLLTLPPLDQYKLWVSILHMDYDIERALPIVLPLRKSSSSFVADVFKLKLEYEIENFGVPIIDIFEKYADPNDPEDQALISRLKEKNEYVTEMMRHKSVIKELNPYYTQSKLMKEFNEIWNSKFNTSIQKGINKGSVISQLATTVILAKGGGWKQDGEVDSRIGKLSKIGASMVFPRQHSISPNKYDYEMRTWYIEDWTKDFKRWEAIVLL
ncbi:hypothetical protein [Pedobacter faecalis]|uniref:hypothetical protein n=1 Tax=Pedobacter faecalis TaxID=3041495 RepID=UPI00254C97EF|nr:hypothetical protein [Pedobacter sp. ELA7]